MKSLGKTILLFTVCWLAACASNNKLRVHEVSSLASNEPGTASFKGLEFLADPIPGKLKNRVNIIYLHGIGWTESDENEPLANEFLAGIAKAYGLKLEGKIISSSCGQSEEEDGTTRNDQIYIKADAPRFYETTLPGSKLKVNNLVCMDKQTLEVDDNLEFVVYRTFWDDIFWNSLQFPHVGQDDDRGSSSTGIASLRRKYNRRLKDELVNYGFSDAVMYLGPAGVEIRNAIQGAMCAAILDAAGYTFEDQGASVSHTRVCELATNTSVRTNQFAFVTESLGSKITYDVMRDSLTDGRDTILDDMISGSEFYMLANQLPLLSLNDLTPTPKVKPKLFQGDKRPKIIAMSELNDFLTYELIPFYEQLWKRSMRDNDTDPNLEQLDTRERMVNDIGFDIVDMRVEFSDALIPLVNGLVDPLQAHSGHAGEPELMLYMLCGARNGKLHKEDCLATSRLEDE